MIEWITSALLAAVIIGLAFWLEEKYGCKEDSR